jgi:ribosomal protein S12 methylthiotransferase accessory factor
VTVSRDVIVIGDPVWGGRIGPRVREEASRLGLRRRSLTVQLACLDRLGSSTIEPATGNDVLYISFWQSLIYVGPRHTLGSRGCGACLLARLTETRYGPPIDAFGIVRRSEYYRAMPLITAGQMEKIAALASVLWTAPDGAPAEVFIVHSRTGAVARERLLPVANCLGCGPEPVLTVPHFSVDALGSERISRRPAEELAAQLDATYAQPHLGLVRGILQDLQAPAATTTAEVRHGTLRAELTIGRSHNFVSSRSIATLEALERYCGLRNDVLRGAVRASFNNVADRAIDPRSLGLYPDDSYRIDGFPFLPFDADRPLAWLPAHSFARGGPLLVPAAAAFYSPEATLDGALLGESSNGCALGSSVEDAAIHAVLELVERDAFLMMWYRRLRLPELSLAGLPLCVKHLIQKVELIAGFDIRAFISTMEHGIPSIVVAGQSRRADGPTVLVSAGAHAQLEIAVGSAVHELAGLLLRVQHRFEEQRTSALAMLTDADLVRTIEDHPMVNCLAEARSRFDFLLDGKPDLQALADNPAPPNLVEGTEKQRLDSMAGRLRAVGLDLIVVDQTCSELHAAGLHCVKAIVPGLLPMTFGHRFRRLKLPRLSASTIYPNDTLTGLSDLPHPFP